MFVDTIPTCDGVDGGDTLDTGGTGDDLGCGLFNILFLIVVGSPIFNRKIKLVFVVNRADFIMRLPPYKYVY